MGAVILLNNNTIAYASKDRHAKIEKDLLAIVFVCQWFYQYIYAAHIQIETQHQPLLDAIFILKTTKSMCIMI